MKIFKHRCKLGDIIYSLPVIKHMGGGVLYLDPDSPHFPNQHDIWVERFQWLIPLLRRQPYIEHVKVWEGEPYEVDLDDYMKTTHLTKGDRVSIVDNHFIAQGFEPVPYNPWLHACGMSRLNATIVANSNNHHDPELDWRKYIKGNELFVGTEKEADEFADRCEHRLRNIVCENALQLAEIIKGAEIFMGNQSLPLAIALGLGKRCLVEETPLYPNCIMGNYVKL